MRLPVGNVWSGIAGHNVTRGRYNLRADINLLPLCGSGNLHLKLYGCLFARYKRRGDVSTPCGDMYTVSIDNMHISV